MLDGERRALAVVGAEGDASGVPSREGVDDRDRQVGEIDRQAAVDALARGDDAVDLLVEHRVDVGLAERGVVLDGAEEDRDAVVGERLADRRP